MAKEHGSTRHPLNLLASGLRWRIKRLRQFIRIRYLSWRHGEAKIAGIRIPLTPYISDNVREAMFDGGYEAAELLMISANLSPNDRVMEIGTGIGLISSYCAKLIGSDRVFTFEANPELRDPIHEVYRLNGVTPTVEFCVLGDSEGYAFFNVHKDFWSSSLHSRSHPMRIVKVPKKDLNKTIQRIRPTFLIIDIEGGESELFEYIDLTGINKIAIELHTSIIGKKKVDAILMRLSEEGFRIDWNCSNSIPEHKEELFLNRVMQRDSVKTWTPL